MVVDFGTNGKRVCDFLLAINSNLGPVSEILQVSAENSDPTPISLEFWGFSPWTRLPIGTEIIDLGITLNGHFTLRMFGALKPGFRSLATLELVVNAVGEL